MSQDENIEEEGIQTYLQGAILNLSDRLQEIVVVELTEGDCAGELTEDSFKGPVAKAVERSLKDGIVALADPRGHWIDIYVTRPYPLLVMEFQDDCGTFKADEPKKIKLRIPKMLLKKAKR